MLYYSIVKTIKSGLHFFNSIFQLLQFKSENLYKISSKHSYGTLYELWKKCNFSLITKVSCFLRFPESLEWCMDHLTLHCCGSGMKPYLHSCCFFSHMPRFQQFVLKATHISFPFNNGNINYKIMLLKYFSCSDDAYL